MKKSELLWLTIPLVITFLGGFMCCKSIYSSKDPKIELPEEYRLIDKSDNLRGYYDQDSILHIEFNNIKNK